MSDVLTQNVRSIKQYENSFQWKHFMYYENTAILKKIIKSFEFMILIFEHGTKD